MHKWIAIIFQGLKKEKQRIRNKKEERKVGTKKEMKKMIALVL